MDEDGVVHRLLLQRGQVTLEDAEDEQQEDARAAGDKVMTAKRVFLERQLFVLAGRRTLNFTVGMAIEQPSVSSLGTINTSILTLFEASHTSTNKGR